MKTQRNFRLGNLALFGGVMLVLTAAPHTMAALVAFYDAEGDTLDSSGNGNHATANGTGFGYSASVASTISGRSTQSFDLTGDSGSDFVSLPTDFSGTASASGASLSLWVRSGSGVGTDYVFSVGNSTNNTPIYGIQGNPTGGTAMRVFYRNDANTSDNAAGTATVFGNGWHHLVLTDDGTTARVYVDGASTPDITLTYPSGALTVDRNALGVLDRNSPFGFLDGQIDEVAIYDTVLTTAQIGLLAGGANPTTIPEPSSSGALGLGILLLLRRRRSRS